MIISGSLSTIALSMNCTSFKCGTVFISIFGNVASYFLCIPKKSDEAFKSLFNSLSSGRNARAFASVHIIATSTISPSCDHLHMDAPAPRTSSSGCATTNKYFIVFVFIYIKFKHCVIIIHLSIVFFASSTNPFNIQVHSLPHTA